MALTPEELQNMITLQRQIAWQFDLDKYTESQVRLLRGSINNVKNEITTYLNGLSPAEWTSERLDSVLAEVRRLSLGVEGEITDGLTDSFVTAGREAMAAQNNMLSFGGRITGFNFAGLGPGQLASMAQSTPVGGLLLNTWVSKIFNGSMEKLRQETLTGILKGEGYPKFVKRFQESFTDLSRSEAITLVRSYVQAANVNAQKEVYRQNPEIVPYVEWSAVMEPGYYKTGRGTCLRCAALDGQIFTIDTSPPIPLHPRCRCVLLPKTPTYRELGLDIDEIKESYKPYTIRDNKNVDAGGRRKILEVGFHDGDYSTWFAKRPDSFQLNVLGPARLKLYKSGKFNFNQFVNKSTGNLYTLDELKSFTGSKPPGGYSPKKALKPKKKTPKIQAPKTISPIPKTAPVVPTDIGKTVKVSYPTGKTSVTRVFVIDKEVAGTKMLKGATIKSDINYNEAVKQTTKGIKAVQASKLIPEGIGFDEVRFNGGRNPADSYWAKQYKIKGFRSFANAGQTESGLQQLNLWGGALTSPQNISAVIPHEIAHVAAKNITGDYDLGKYKDRWQDLIKKEGYASNYAESSKSIAEDFADYVGGRILPDSVAIINDEAVIGDFAKLFPGKTKLYNEIIKGKK